jgi:hypothetical protein|tara:strand:- start:72 stop:536 length:465 start_codon:yes stop_codon:yes gene_type:complete
MKRAINSFTWWVGIALFLPFIVAMAVSAPWSLGGKLAPWIVGSCAFIALSLHSYLGVRMGVDAKPEALPEGVHPFKGHALRVYAWVALLLILIPLLGHQIATPLFIIVFMLASGESLWLAILLAAAIGGFIFFILEKMIHVGLPAPLIAQWLGL